jgi:hypothetical protein
MKICWDNLEQFIYDKINVCWKNKYNVKYIYRDTCEICGDPYLMRITDPTNCCCGSCAKIGKNHHFYNKVFSNEHKLRLSNARMGYKVSKETCLKISKTLKNSGHNKFGKNAHNYKGGVTKLNLPLYDTYVDRLSYFEEVRRNPNDVNILQVKCTNSNCRKWFSPKRTSVCDRINALKFDYTYGEQRFYCSEKCKQTCVIYKQILYPRSFKDKQREYTSYELNIWREEVLKRTNYKCEYCGKTATDAHHEKPKKLEPFFALDPNNGIACCKECHYKYGHSDECSTGSLAARICK